MKISLQHIHLVSKDKYRLAEWYRDNLGFEIREDLEKLGEPGGPLLVTGDGGATSLSIFTRPDSRPPIFPAFEAAALDDFVELHRKFGEPRIYDHFRFFSFYVHDADETKIEICITDYESAKKRLDVDKVDYVPMTPETYTP